MLKSKLITHQLNIIYRHKKKILLFATSSHTLFAVKCQNCYIPSARTFLGFSRIKAFFLGLSRLGNCKSQTQVFSGTLQGPYKQCTMVTAWPTRMAVVLEPAGTETASNGHKTKVLLLNLSWSQLDVSSSTLKFSLGRVEQL